MRLISANELAKAVCESRKKNPHKNDDVRRNHDYEHDHFMKMICDTPTVDAELLVHAHWKYSEYMHDPVYICSNCGCEIDEAVFDRIPNNGCPKCRAKMDGV